MYLECRAFTMLTMLEVNAVLLKIFVLISNDNKCLLNTDRKIIFAPNSAKKKFFLTVLYKCSM